MKELAERIIRYRAKHSLTQKKFAEKAGLSSLTILQIEKGTTKPTALTRAKIELVLGSDNNEGE